MARIVLSGHATVDYVMTSPAPPRGAGSHMVEIADPAHWPRPGGAPYYAGRRLAAHGIVAAPLISIGDDANGAAYLSACDAAGLPTRFVERQEGGRTPCCMMIHHAHGETTTFIDPGVARPLLSSRQCDAAQAAEMVVLAAGDAARTQALLDLLRPDQEVVWVVKHDPASFPPALAAQLAARADIVFCNASERGFVDAQPQARTPRLLFETRGADGLVIERDGARHLLPTRPVSVGDATGAGDTLAGEVLARMLQGADPLAAATAALEIVSAFLEARSSRPA